MNIKNTVVSIAAGVAIGTASFFAGAVTDIGDALKIAFDQEAAIEYCEKLVTGDLPEDEDESKNNNL